MKGDRPNLWLLAAVVLGAATTTAAEAEHSKSERKELATHFRAGKDYQRDGELKNAAEAFQRVLAIDPEHFRAHVQLGSVHMTPGPTFDLAESARQFERALEIKPGSEDALSALARVTLNQGKFSEAADKFRMLANRFPGQFETYYLLGVSCLRQGDTACAVPAFEAALEIQPGEVRCLWSLKIAYDAEGGYPQDLPEQYRLTFFEPEVSAPDVRFADVASESGVAKFDGGRGSTWADYDGDGDLDLFSACHYAPFALFRNNGDGTFTDVAAQAGVDDTQGAWASLFADYDNDGDPDLYLTRDGWFGNKPNTLYRNNGDGTFSDVTQAAEVGGSGSSFCATFGDFDNDGYLDLLVANGTPGDGSPNALYRNNGDGTFTDVASDAGVDDTGPAVGAAFGDYDNDGDLDIHLVNLDGSLLFANNGDRTFADVTAAAGLNTPIQRGFVTFFFDYDNDGHLDLFISTHGSFVSSIRSRIEGHAVAGDDTPLLYRNNGDGTFSDVTRGAGLGITFGTMAANFGDIDNDGFADLYLANSGPLMGRWEPDAVYRNNGDGTFSPVTELVGLNNLGKGHGIAFADYDADGDLDFYLPIGGGMKGDEGTNSLYRNEGNANHWLQLGLVGTDSNRDAIGARVMVHTGPVTRHAEVSSGFGFGSSSLPLEFGLGAHTEVDSVVIRWPSGRRQVMKNLSSDQAVTVTEGS